jgi:hypothetical protein
LQEILHKREQAGVFVLLFERWLSSIVSQVLAVTAFIAGAILLFCGTTPVVEQRIVFLKQLVALPLSRETI